MRADFFRRSKPLGKGLRRVRLATLAAGTALGLASLPGAARADVIQSWTFTTGSSVVLGSSTEVISGTFKYDSTIDVQQAASVTLTGAAPYAGTYVEPATIANSGSGLSACSNAACTGTTLGFSFLDLFSLGISPDPLSTGIPPEDNPGVQWFSASGADTIGSSVSASAFLSTGSPPSGIPEPSSLALLAVGMAGSLLLFGRRVSRGR